MCGRMELDDSPKPCSQHLFAGGRSYALSSGTAQSTTLRGTDKPSHGQRSKSDMKRPLQKEVLEYLM